MEITKKEDKYNFEPNEEYYIKVITKKYPSIFRIWRSL